MLYLQCFSLFLELQTSPISRIELARELILLGAQRPRRLLRLGELAFSFHHKLGRFRNLRVLDGQDFGLVLVVPVVKRHHRDQEDHQKPGKSLVCRWVRFGHVRLRGVLDQLVIDQGNWE